MSGRDLHLWYLDPILDDPLQAMKKLRVPFGRQGLKFKITYSHAVAFTYDMLNLICHYPMSKLNSNASNRLLDKIIRAPVDEILSEKLKIIYKDINLYSRGCDDAYREFITERIKALLAVGQLAQVLRENKYKSGPGDSWQTIPIPSARTIPFSSILELPRPFSPFTPTMLMTCNISSMAKQKFLEDGEWVGCEVNPLELRQSRHIQPPMRGIFFQYHPGDLEDYRACLKASGR